MAWSGAKASASGLATKRRNGRVMGIVADSGRQGDEEVGGACLADGFGQERSPASDTSPDGSRNEMIPFARWRGLGRVRGKGKSQIKRPAQATPSGTTQICR